MLYMSKNEIQWQADINRIILVNKLPLQPVMLGVRVSLAMLTPTT